MFRPKDFSEIFGQEHIIKTLENIDLRGKAIFFEGKRGTGKTSISKILAERFTDSEHNRHHINCGEIGKEIVKNYIRSFNDSSIFGKNKCYIFDEPQSLHHSAMSSMLVPVENLRDNILVILCSMEPGKVKEALSDRFIILKTKSLDDKTSMEFLNFICKRNSIKLDKFKKVLIIKKCDGNPRLIVNAIPKIINVDEKKDIEYLLDIHSILGDEDDEVLLLYKVILDERKSWASVRGLLNKLLKKKSPDVLRMGMMNIIGGALLKGVGGREEKMLNIYNILRDANGIPDKANLITALAKLYF